MHPKIDVELHAETILKLEKLAKELGLTIDELINKSLEEALYEMEPVNA